MRVILDALDASREQPIGRGFRRSTQVQIAAALVGLTGIALDMFAYEPWDGQTRMLSALGFGAVLWLLAGRDLQTLGLGTRVLPRWTYWIKASLLIGVIVAVFTAAVMLAMHFLGYELSSVPAYTHASQFWTDFKHAVIQAPIVEEPIYRLMLCAPLLPLIGRWPTIFVSGAVFGGLHFLYGNPAPNNFIAGYVIGWAYIHSGSLKIPVLLHALGNGCVLLANMAHFYWYYW